MLMVYSPGTTEAMFADMTALSEEERRLGYRRRSCGAT